MIWIDYLLLGILLFAFSPVILIIIVLCLYAVLTIISEIWILWLRALFQVWNYTIELIWGKKK